MNLYNNLNKSNKSTTLSNQSQREISSLTKDQSKVVSTIFEINDNIKNIISTLIDEEVTAVFN